MRNITKVKDITGNKYNRLTALRIVSYKPVKWECRCDCGNIHIVSASNLTTGQVKSCGCLHGGCYRHNQSRTRLYRIYAKIKRRCYVKDDPAYHNYGGRGIEMCDEWKDSFINFSEWAYSNGYNDSLTIDRIDNNEGYNPENCRWADYYQQSNNRRYNRIISYEGKDQTLAEWCREKNISYGTIWARLKSGMTFEEAINKPIISGRRNNA